ELGDKRGVAGQDAEVSALAGDLRLFGRLVHHLPIGSDDLELKRVCHYFPSAFNSGGVSTNASNDTALPSFIFQTWATTISNSLPFASTLPRVCPMATTVSPASIQRSNSTFESTFSSSLPKNSFSPTRPL